MGATISNANIICKYIFRGVFSHPMKKLAMIRKKRGLTQIQLATRMGTTAPAVCKWEKGVNQPHRSTIARLMVALRCKESELV